MRGDAHHAEDCDRVGVEMHIFPVFDLSELTECKARIEKDLSGLMQDPHEGLCLHVPTSVFVTPLEWNVVAPHLFVSRSYPYDRAEVELGQDVASGNGCLKFVGS